MLIRQVTDTKMYVYNYRPVTVLPLLSTILERLRYNSILINITFINKHNILYRYHIDFRQHYSAHLAFTLIDKITEALEKGECVL